MLAPQPALKLPSTAVERSFDAAEFNRILNDPSVRPHVGFLEVGELDVTAHLEDPNNYYLAAEGGAIFFAHDLEPGIYELHTNFLAEGPTPFGIMYYRGRHAIECSRSAYAWMFTRTDCGLIVTRIPANNRPAAMAARAVGFRHMFTRKNVWPVGEDKVDMKFYAMDYETWLAANADVLIAEGRRFHELLEREKKRHGVEQESHPDEDCHDLRAGACVQMIDGGQVIKGILLYNRWARFAGYGQIRLIADAPIIIDIGDAILQVQDHSIKVVKVKCPPQPS